MQILIVDDQPQALKLVQDLLRAQWPTAELLRANGVAMALQIASQHDLDLVITDWQMPDASGLDLIKQLQRRLPDLPVIIYSGLKIQSEDLLHALQTGAVDYLRKPLDALEFHARVHNTLRLAQMQRSLRQRDHSKNIFFSLLSHHLLGDAWQLNMVFEMLNQHQQRHSFDYYQNMLKEAQAVSQSHHHLLSQLLDLARLLFQERQPQFEVCDVRGCLLSCQAQFDTERVKIRANRDLQVKADPQILLQILQELVSNGLNASEQQAIRLSARQLGPRILFEIRDTGFRLNQEALQACLTPLFSRPEAAEGFMSRGLGLPICHELLHLLDSRLEGETDASGTVFRFYLLAAT